MPLSDLFSPAAADAASEPATQNENLSPQRVQHLRQRLWKSSLKLHHAAESLKVSRSADAAAEGTLKERTVRLTFGSFNSQAKGSTKTSQSTALVLNADGVMESTVVDQNITSSVTRLQARGLYSHLTAQRMQLGKWLSARPIKHLILCLLYTSPSPRDRTRSRMPSSA